MPLILRANDGERQELFFICATSVTIYPPAEFQITIQTGNNCPSPLRAVAMQYTAPPRHLPSASLRATAPVMCCPATSTALHALSPPLYVLALLSKDFFSYVIIRIKLVNQLGLLAPPYIHFLNLLLVSSS